MSISELSNGIFPASKVKHMNISEMKDLMYSASKKQEHRLLTVHLITILSL